MCRALNLSHGSLSRSLLLYCVGLSFSPLPVHIENVIQINFNTTHTCAHTHSVHREKMFWKSFKCSAERTPQFYDHHRRHPFCQAVQKCHKLNFIKNNYRERSRDTPPPLHASTRRNLDRSTCAQAVVYTCKHFLPQHISCRRTQKKRRKSRD